MKGTLKYINRILFFMLVCGSLFAIFPSFMDTAITSKWIFTKILVGAIGLALPIGFLCGRTKYDLNYASVVILLCTTSQAIYGLFTFYWEDNSIRGSFDNPTGFISSLCFTLPFALHLLRESALQLFKYLCLIAVVILTITVFMSSSRCGICSIAITIIAYLHTTYKKRIIIYIGVMIFIITCIVSLCIKQDSTKGRILIWNCSWEMIKNAPLSGYGNKGFDIHYMDYQADYFRKHPQSKYAQLADNTRRPFNEFLSLNIKYGISGTLLSLIFLGFLIYSYYKHPSSNAFLCISSLISVAIFSLFSYPFEYPFTWIISALCTIILLSPMIKIKSSFRKVTSLSLLILSGTILINTIRETSLERRWYLANKRPSQEGLREYYQLYPYLKTNAFFLYNYAAILCKCGENKKALSVANYCRKYLLADYDLELLRANLYKSENKYMEALQCFNHAANMCPSRFIPLYEMYRIYKTMGNVDKTDSIANVIICKDVKIESSIIEKMKRRILSERE